MIQIQDYTPSQTAPVAPVADPSYQSSVSQAPTASVSPSNDPIIASKQDNNAAEIDKLLAELDKLSRDLEEKPDAVVSEPVVVQADSSVTPVADEAQTPVMPEPVTSAVAEPAKEEGNEEKFDFDSFLADLEKKIDQESKKNSPAEASSTESTVVSPTISPVEPVPAADEDNFRKERPVAELASEEEDMADESPVSVSPVNAEKEAEDLKSQNIFDMLGLLDISDEEKNQFLDELESMIWDDFVTHDLELLLTSEEYGKARQVLDNSSASEDQRKEDLIVFLETLIPDLDEVLYEKALELKSEMMGERLAKMKESTDESILAKVKEAEDMISQNLWKSAAALLNQSR